MASRVLETFPDREGSDPGLAPDETAWSSDCARRGTSRVSWPGRFAQGRRYRGDPPSTVGLLEASKAVATATKGRAAADDRLVARAVVFVSHAAFWKTRARERRAEESYEHYFDALLSESKRRGLPP